MILLTGASRWTGAGTYVAQLARSFPGEMSIFYDRALSPAAYDAAPTLAGLWPDARLYLKARLALDGAADRTHITGEGFGPLFGRRTRLVTVHQVLRRDVPNGHSNGFSHGARGYAVRRPASPPPG